MLTVRLMHYNVLVERLDPKPFLLVVVCQIHSDVSKRYRLNSARFHIAVGLSQLKSFRAYCFISLKSILYRCIR